MIEIKTYDSHRVYLEGWYTKEDLRLVIDSIDLLNEKAREIVEKHFIRSRDEKKEKNT